MKSRIRICLGALCCGVTLLTCIAPVHASESVTEHELVASYFDHKNRRPSLYDPQFLESVIRYGYERLESLTAAEGARVDFELDDFETYRDADFSSLVVSDISTLPGGESLQITLRRVWSHEKDLLLEERLEPRWIERYDQASQPSVKRQANLSLDEVYEANREHYSGEVLGVTTYRVRVSFEGKSRSYRANFLWLASREDQESWEDEELRFLPIDHVTIGLISAYALSSADGIEKPAPLKRRESHQPSDFPWS